VVGALIALLFRVSERLGILLARALLLVPPHYSAASARSTPSTPATAGRKCRPSLWQTSLWHCWEPCTLPGRSG